MDKLGSLRANSGQIGDNLGNSGFYILLILTREALTYLVMSTWMGTKLLLDGCWIDKCFLLPSVGGWGDL